MGLHHFFLTPTVDTNQLSSLGFTLAFFIIADNFSTASF
jgi:hypothetical protein